MQENFWERAVTDFTDRVGYAHLGYFDRAFKRHYGKILASNDRGKSPFWDRVSVLG
jgi:hypothetical protein